MQNILVIGLGKSGQSVVRYLLKDPTNRIFVTDDKYLQNVEGTSEAVSIVPIDAVSLEAINQVIVSPGIAFDHSLISAAKERGIEVIGDTELAFREIRNKKIRACGITGTNGKTTTTALTTHILNKCGILAVAAGNIGIPLLDIISTLGEELLVIELSSFQLCTTTTSCLTAAALLNITPNHLDWHKSMEHYVAAKRRIYSLVMEKNLFWVGGKDLYMDSFTDCASFIDPEIRIKLQSRYPEFLSHHIDNALAAVALATAFGVSISAAISAISDFAFLPHRLSYIGTNKGVSYYNDSKATNVEAVCAAVAAFDKKIILIAGGVHKGHSYEKWAKLFLNKVRVVLAIGSAQNIILSDLEGFIPVELCTSLEEAVLKAKTIAQSGEIVLLSPGCSSYDMFENYEERGARFIELVTAVDQS